MKIVLQQSRTEVNTFKFDVTPEDAQLLQDTEGKISDELTEYIFSKYCFDKDGYIQNLVDSYGESERFDTLCED